MSDTYEVRMSLRVSGGPDRAAHFETVVDAFAALEVVHAELLDSSFGFTDGGAHADLDAELTVRAVGEREAYRLASSCVRSAIQAAGGATPEWDELAPHDLAIAVYRVTDESVGLVSV